MDDLDQAKAQFAEVAAKFVAANERMEKAGTAIFALYKYLLGENDLHKRNKIVSVGVEGTGISW